jgi:hypothetical protein
MIRDGFFVLDLGDPMKKMEWDVLDVLDGENWEQDPIYREGGNGGTQTSPGEMRTRGMFTVLDSSSAYKSSKSIISLPHRGGRAYLRLAL